MDLNITVSFKGISEIVDKVIAASRGFQPHVSLCSDLEADLKKAEKSPKVEEPPVTKGFFDEPAEATPKRRGRPPKEAKPAADMFDAPEQKGDATDMFGAPSGPKEAKAPKKAAKGKWDPNAVTDLVIAVQGTAEGKAAVKRAIAEAGYTKFSDIPVGEELDAFADAVETILHKE